MIVWGEQILKWLYKSENSRRSGSNSSRIARTLIYNGIVIQIAARSAIWFWLSCPDKTAHCSATLTQNKESLYVKQKAAFKMHYT